MAAQLKLKPTKKIRIERAEPREVHDDTHSWAVSYADFLMVLLSFFILFFSVDAKKRDELVDKLAATGTANSNHDSKVADRTNLNTPSLPSGLGQLLPGMEGYYVETPGNTQKVFLYFQDNIYKPGKIDLPADQIVKLKETLEKIRPYLKQINITFVGHTDSTAIKVSKNRIVSDNFALSSIRATKALQQAVAAGFDPAGMFAQGNAEFSRGTRTLSLIITPRAGEK